MVGSEYDYIMIIMDQGQYSQRGWQRFQVCDWSRWPSRPITCLRTRSYDSVLMRKTPKSAYEHYCK